jgi:hypothetical protein
VAVPDPRPFPGNGNAHDQELKENGAGQTNLLGSVLVSAQHALPGGANIFYASTGVAC